MWAGAAILTGLVTGIILGVTLSSDWDKDYGNRGTAYESDDWIRRTTASGNYCIF